MDLGFTRDLNEGNWAGHDNFVVATQLDGSQKAQFSDAEKGLTREVQVWFGPDGEPNKVLISIPEGITPTKLKRFAWSSWLTACTAAARMKDPGSTGQAALLVGSVKAVRESTKPPKRLVGKHPGRTGYPLKHYEAVASEYKQLMLSGENKPGKVLAERYVVSPSTMRGWIAQCRKKGLLPPGRQGRAG